MRYTDKIYSILWLYMKLSKKCHFSHCRLSGAWIPAFAGMTYCATGVTPAEAGVQGNFS